WPSTQMTRDEPSARAMPTGYSIIGRPATGCSTLALSDFMRVPRPAARITVASDMSRKYRCAASADQVPAVGESEAPGHGDVGQAHEHEVEVGGHEEGGNAARPVAADEVELRGVDGARRHLIRAGGGHEDGVGEDERIVVLDRRSAAVAVVGRQRLVELRDERTAVATGEPLGADLHDVAPFWGGKEMAAGVGPGGDGAADGERAGSRSAASTAARAATATAAAAVGDIGRATAAATGQGEHHEYRGEFHGVHYSRLHARRADRRLQPGRQGARGD